MCQQVIGIYSTCLAAPAGPSSCRPKRDVGFGTCDAQKMSGRPCIIPTIVHWPFMTDCCSSKCERNYNPASWKDRLQDPKGFTILQDRDVVVSPRLEFIDTATDKVVGWADDGQGLFFLMNDRWKIGRMNLTEEEQEKYREEVEAVVEMMAREVYEEVNVKDMEDGMKADVKDKEDAIKTDVKDKEDRMETAEKDKEDEMETVKKDKEDETEAEWTGKMVAAPKVELREEAAGRSRK